MIIPSIDLINGNVVRLYQGKYNLKTLYNENVYDIISRYCSQGAKIIHLVDLDGASNPNNKQTSLIKNILNSFGVSIQVGGGIRSYQDAQRLLVCGAKRVVIGSYAIYHSQEIFNWISEFGSESIVLALDLCIHPNGKKEVVTNAWKKFSGVFLEEMIVKFRSFGLKHVLCTDVKKDGTLFGPNFDLYKEICSKFKNINFQLSGGIGTINDIILSRRAGIQDVIIGRALLEKKFSLFEAIQCWQKELFHA